MKKLLLPLLVALCCLPIETSAQQMHVKQPNFVSFSSSKKSVSAYLERTAIPEEKAHPEFGLLPYNAPCSNCSEIVSKRTINSRFFVDEKNPQHTYSQQSYLPVHYTDAFTDELRTIDSRLRPVAGMPNFFVASKQPVTTTCDLNNHCTSLVTGGKEFKFNSNLTLYYTDANGEFISASPGNYSNYTIGEEGQYVSGFWNGIDMQQAFTTGEIKTSYFIKSPLQLPATDGWLVIEDHLVLPAGFTISEANRDGFLPNGFYAGEYVIKDAAGTTQYTYSKPVYYDLNVTGSVGLYKLVGTGNDYTLRLFVPYQWLNKTDNVYPLTIDPIVAGSTKFGDYRSTGLPTASMGFTSQELGSCDYQMTVFVPGNSQIERAYAEMEYQLTYDNNCDSPALPPPFCTFAHVSMEVVSDSCQTTTGLLTCNPANPPYTGTCTTDSNLVPGAMPINITQTQPGYLSCYQVQLPDYNISFTLKDRDSTCGDVCGYLCARGNMWRMTVEALYLDTLQTSIQSASASNQFAIHPNPATNQLIIETNGTAVNEVNIYNTTGSLVMAAVGSSMVNGQLSIVNLANGVYIAEIKTKEASVMRRWVKM